MLGSFLGYFEGGAAAAASRGVWIADVKAGSGEPPLIIHDRAFVKTQHLRVNQNLLPRLAQIDNRLAFRFVELHAILSSGATTLLDKNSHPCFGTPGFSRGQGLQVKHGGFSNGDHALQLTANGPERQREYTELQNAGIRIAKM